MDSCPTLEFKVSELFFALFIVGHSPNSLGHPKNILWILLDTWGQKCNYIKTLRITSFMCSEKIIDIKVGVSLSLLVSIQLSLTSYCLFYFSENTCTNVEYFCGRHNCET